MISLDVSKLHTAEVKRRVRRRKGSEELTGHHVLKIVRIRQAEASIAIHGTATNDPAIAPYVPKIVLDIDHPDLGLSAVFYEVATGGLIHSTTLENLLTIEFDHATRVLEKLARTLLQWSAKQVVSRNPLEVITEGLGWRLGGSDTDQEETLQARLAPLVRPLGASHLESSLLDRKLINPLPFILDARDFPRQSLLLGPTHGDLHTGNVIALRSKPFPPPLVSLFQIIDFGMRPELNGLFDLAYLELSILLHSFAGFETESSFRDWWRMERHIHETGLSQIDLGGSHAGALLQIITGAVENAGLDKSQQDAFEVSYLAASVEAALNFARKLYPSRRRQLFSVLIAASRFTRLIELLRITPPGVGDIATLDWASDALESGLAPPPQQSFTPDLERFASHLRDFGATMTLTDGLGVPDGALVRVPMFLLFERAGQVVLAITPSEGSRGHVDSRALQKTNETQVDATLLDRAGLERLGFDPLCVHPLLADPAGTIHRLIWDGTLAAQAILFPRSTVQLPWLDPYGRARKILAPIQPVIHALAAMHAAGGEPWEKTIFASIAPKAWPDPLLLQLLATRPLKTRFAPTPSNRLHLGNARTALASYLLYRQRVPDARFHLRIDDTDPNRNRNEVVPEIRQELSQLGIPLKRYDQFTQSDVKRYNGLYQPFARILERGGLTVNVEGTVALVPLPRASYGNIWFDMRSGIHIEHSAPRARARPMERLVSEDSEPETLAMSNSVEQEEGKQIRLLRKRGKGPYYRFAGLIDDLVPFASLRPESVADPVPITYVLRDLRQRHLTEVQAHIRQALELARRKGATDDTVTKTLEEAGLRAQQELPLPIYLHLPLVKHKDGKILSKTYLQEAFSVQYLLERVQILPEAVTAYLIWTLLPPPKDTSAKRHLDAIARFTGAHGVECALAFFSRQVQPLDLVRSDAPVIADMVHLHRADRVVLRYMAPWILRHKLAPHVGSVDPELVSRIVAHSAELAGWSQLLRVVQRPWADSGRVDPPAGAALRELLNRLFAEGHAPVELVAELHKRIEYLRAEARQAKGSDRFSILYSELSAIQGDLRRILIGDGNSPRIGSLFDILGPEEVVLRIEAVWSET